MQRATDEQFWAEMNDVHSQAYYLAMKHVREAMECIPGISKRQIEAVMAKSEQIREEWDGIQTITVEETEGVQVE